MLPSVDSLPGLCREALGALLGQSCPVLQVLLNIGSPRLDNKLIIAP